MVEEVGELTEKLELVPFRDREVSGNIQVHILKIRHAEVGVVCWCVSVLILIDAIVAIWELNNLVRESIGVPLQIRVLRRFNYVASGSVTGVLPSYQRCIDLGTSSG